MQERKDKERAEVERRFREDKDFSRAIAAKELDVDRRTISKWIESFRKRENTPKINKTRAKVGGTLDNFRKRFDDSVVVPNLIEKGIKKYLIRDGEGRYMRDQDFREVCGVAPGKWRRYADDFKHLQVKKDQIIFWGHPDIIDELRKAANR